MPPKPADAPRSAAGAVWSVSILFAATAIVCLPSQMYLANPTEFPIAFSDVLPLIVALGIGCTFACAAVLFALPKGRARETGIVLAFALSCLAWTQSHLPWPYGVASGQSIDWSAFRRHALADIVLWSAGIGAALWWRSALLRIVTAAGLLVAVVQVSALGIDAARLPHRWIDDVTIDDSMRFTFSKDRNVIVLVLDTFQTDLFQELLDADPSIGGRLEGFTYFRNATGGFPSTAASIPLILTGQYYDNSEPFQDFVRETYRTKSLPSAMTGAGFDVYYNNLYFWPSLYADETIAKHVRSKGVFRYGPQAQDGVERLLTFAAFRYLPQPGKRLLEPKVIGYVLPQAPVSAAAAPSLESLHAAPAPTAEPPLPGDGPFFQQLARSATTSSERPTFKYFHLWGLHPPLTHDEAFLPMTAPYTRANALRQARGLLHLVDRFLASVKTLGIYDQSTIAILGDHGTAFELRLPTTVDPAARTHPAGQPVPTEHVFGLPLVLFKRPGDAGPLAVSDAAVTLGDVPRTIMDTLALSSDFPGVSMFSTDIQTARNRRVLFYPADQLNLSAEYFPPLREFQVSGFSWLEESWRQTGKVLRPD